MKSNIIILTLLKGNWSIENKCSWQEEQENKIKSTYGGWKEVDIPVVTEKKMVSAERIDSQIWSTNAIHRVNGNAQT